ncbi:MAG TPA: hypothetical protein VJ438_06015 [Candidatus Nanoarchaeia archaeon]|nr:hypothetical protein [Candidatus Nanoarchaeia archaeon]
MKLTKKQIEKIRELSEKGKKQMEIAEIMKVSQWTISYWLGNDDKRKEISQKNVELFRKKPKSERQKIYKRRLEYIKGWRRKKYHTDDVFRKKELKRIGDYYRRKDGNRL